MSNLNRTHCNPQGYLTIFRLGNGDLRFAVKDTLDVAGWPTRAGSQARENTLAATRNAAVIDTLLGAGCVLTGKTVLHELAFGVTGINQWAGTPVNPRYPALIPGGSSSGSATAVAAASVEFAIGTDTGGSVRMPAACCAIVGLKPTFGRVSREGVMPAASSLDCVGFFTRDLAMMEQVLTRLGFPDGDEPESTAPALLAGAARADIDALIARVLATHGVRYHRAELPLLDAAHNAALHIIGHENACAFADLADNPDVSSDVRRRITLGTNITAAELAEAEEVRLRFSAAVDALLERHGVLLLPALPDLPPTLEQARDPLSAVNLTRLLRPFNLSGHPALVLPLGEIDARPVALQLVGRKGHERALLYHARRLLSER